MSYTMPGQGGVGGAVAYYFYLNGVFEGLVNPADAGAFEGNWAQLGISSLAVSPGQAVVGNSISTTSPPLPKAPSPAASSGVPGVTVGSTPGTDSRNVSEAFGRGGGGGGEQPSGASSGSGGRSTPTPAPQAAGAGSTAVATSHVDVSL
jgi:hypothetical protein